jgi:uncharacterized protein (TIGR02300 family)
MTKPELGTKRLCTECGARYYDLNTTPIACPKCGARFKVVETKTGSRTSQPDVSEIIDGKDNENQHDT